MGLQDKRSALMPGPFFGRRFGLNAVLSPNFKFIKLYVYIVYNTLIF
jgi:hypothetical protein